MSEKQLQPSADRIVQITTALADLDQTVAASMSHIYNLQKWSMDSLCARFMGIPKATVKKYMEPTYLGVRPIHFAAAYSWVTMVPMTSFFKGIKILEDERGMDKLAVEAIIRCGQLSKKHFQITLDYIYERLDDKGKKSYDKLYDKVCKKFGHLDDYNDKEFLPPKKLDMVSFGEDYYYSIALALQDFRRLNQLSVEITAAALGLSVNQYQILEDPHKNKVNQSFSVGLGLRVRLAFRSYCHVEFTKYMRKYPQLHKLRKVQHIRDALIVESLRFIPKNQKEPLIKVMQELAPTYTYPQNDKMIPVSHDELAYINLQLKDAGMTAAISMKYIYTIQGWDYADLEKRFKGISRTTWRRYFQPSYKKMRPLHIVAAYSWLTMVPMPSFYYGLKIKEKYLGMDEPSIEAMIYSGILPTQQFQLILDYIYECISPQNKEKVDIFRGGIEGNYGFLQDYKNEQFIFPERLDIDAFAKDYYYSVAISFREFREANGLNINTLATVLGMTPYAYKRCEDPDCIYRLPVEIAVRLKLGFRLTDAMPFTQHMREFKQFHTLRKVQHLRETLLIEMLSYIHPKDKPDFVQMIKSIASIYTRSIHR